MTADRVIAENHKPPNSAARADVLAAITSKWQTAADVAFACGFSENYASGLLRRLWRAGKIEREKAAALSRAKPNFVYRENHRTHRQP